MALRNSCSQRSLSKHATITEGCKHPWCATLGYSQSNTADMKLSGKAAASRTSARQQASMPQPTRPANTRRVLLLDTAEVQVGASQKVL